MKRAFLVFIFTLVILTITKPSLAQCWPTDVGTDPYKVKVLPGKSLPRAAAEISSNKFNDLLSTAENPDTSNQYEKILVDETARLNKSMGLSAKLYMLPNEANAFANPNDRNVYYGRPMTQIIKDMRNGNGRVFNEADLIAGIKMVLAHEFGHLLQFDMWRRTSKAIQSPSPTNEMQADVLAGLWAGMNLMEGGVSGYDVIASIQTAFNVGDEQWTSPKHHGSPLTRFICIADGIRNGQMHRFGSLESAYLDSSRSEVFKWSLGVSRENLKKDRNQRTF